MIPSENLDEQSPNADILTRLIDLEHLGSVLHGRQQAGLPITPIMWEKLHERCSEAKAAIAANYLNRGIWIR
jgi:hypothetical protein